MKKILNFKMLTTLSSLGAIAIVNQNTMNENVGQIRQSQQNKNLSDEELKKLQIQEEFGQSKELDKFFGKSTNTKTMEQWLNSPEGIKTFNDWVKSQAGEHALKPKFTQSDEYKKAIDDYVKDKRTKSKWSTLQAGIDSYDSWRTSSAGVSNLEPIFKSSSSFKTKQEDWIAKGPNKRSKTQWLESSESDAHYAKWYQKKTSKQPLITSWKKTSNYQSAKDAWIALQKKPSKTEWLALPSTKGDYLTWKNLANGISETSKAYKKTKDYEDEKTKWINLQPKMSKENWLNSDYSNSAYHSWRKSVSGLSLLTNNFKTTSAYTTALNDYLALKPKRSKQQWLNTNYWHNNYQTWIKTTSAQNVLKTSYKKTTEFDTKSKAWIANGPQKPSLDTWLYSKSSDDTYLAWTKTAVGASYLDTEYKKSTTYTSNLQKYLDTVTKRSFDFWKASSYATPYFNSWKATKLPSQFTTQYKNSSQYQSNLQSYLAKSPAKRSKQKWYSDASKYYLSYFNEWKKDDNENTWNWFKKTYRDGPYPTSWKEDPSAHPSYWTKDVPTWLAKEKLKKTSALEWLKTPNADAAYTTWSKTSSGQQALFNEWKKTNDYATKKALYDSKYLVGKRSKNQWLQLDAAWSKATNWNDQLSDAEKQSKYLSIWKQSAHYQNKLKAYLDASPNKRSKTYWSSLPHAKSAYNNWKVISSNEDKLLNEFVKSDDYTKAFDAFKSENQKKDMDFETWKKSAHFQDAYNHWVKTPKGEKIIRKRFENTYWLQDYYESWYKKQGQSLHNSFSTFWSLENYKNFDYWFKSRATASEKAKMKDLYFKSDDFEWEYQNWKATTKITSDANIENFGINQFSTKPSGKYALDFLNKHNFNNNFVWNQYYQLASTKNDYYNWMVNTQDLIHLKNNGDYKYSSRFKQLHLNFKNNLANQDLLNTQYKQTQLMQNRLRQWKSSLKANNGEKLNTYLQNWRGTEYRHYLNQWIDTLTPFQKNVWDDFKTTTIYQDAKTRYQQDTQKQKTRQNLWTNVSIHNHIKDAVYNAFDHYKKTYEGWNAIKKIISEEEYGKSLKDAKNAWVNKKKHAYDFKYYLNNVYNQELYSNWKNKNQDILTKVWKYGYKQESSYQEKFNQWKNDVSYSKNQWINEKFVDSYYQSWISNNQESEVLKDWFKTTKYQNLVIDFVSQNWLQYQDWLKTKNANDKYQQWVNDPNNIQTIISWWKKDAKSQENLDYKTTYIDSKTSEDGTLSFESKFNDFTNSWKANDDLNNNILNWVKNNQHQGYYNYLRTVGNYPNMEIYQELFNYYKTNLITTESNKWFTNYIKTNFEVKQSDEELDQQLINEHFYNTQDYINYLTLMASEEKKQIYINIITDLLKENDQSIIENFKKYLSRDDDLTLYNSELDEYANYITHLKRIFDEGDFDNLELIQNINSRRNPISNKPYIYEYYHKYKEEKFMAKNKDNLERLFISWLPKASKSELDNYYAQTDHAKNAYLKYVKNRYLNSDDFSSDYQVWFNSKEWPKTYEEEKALAMPKTKDVSMLEWYKSKNETLVKAWKEWIKKGANKKLLSNLYQQKNYSDGDINIDLSNKEYDNVDYDAYVTRWNKWKKQKIFAYTHDEYLDESGAFLNEMWKWIDPTQEDETKGTKKSWELYKKSQQYQDDLKAYIAAGPKKRSYQYWYDTYIKETAFFDWIYEKWPEKPNYDELAKLWEATDEFLLARNNHHLATGTSTELYKRGYAPYETEFAKWYVKYENTGTYFENLFKSKHLLEYEKWIDTKVRTYDNYHHSWDVINGNLKEFQWANIDIFIKAFKDEFNSWEASKRHAFHWDTYWKPKHYHQYMDQNQEGHKYYQFFEKKANFHKSDEYNHHLEKWYRKWENSAFAFLQTQEAKNAFANWKSPAEAEAIDNFENDQAKQGEKALRWAQIYQNGMDNWSKLATTKTLYKNYKNKGLTPWHQKTLHNSIKYQKDFAQWKQETIVAKTGSLHNKYFDIYSNSQKSNLDFNHWLATSAKTEATYQDSKWFKNQLSQWVDENNLKWKSDKINYRALDNWENGLLKFGIIKDYLNWKDETRRDPQDYANDGNDEYVSKINEIIENNRDSLVEKFLKSPIATQYYNAWIDDFAPLSNNFDNSKEFLQLGRQYLKNLAPSSQLDELEAKFKKSKFAHDAFWSQIDLRLYMNVDHYTNGYNKWLNSKMYKDWLLLSNYSNRDLADYKYALKDDSWNLFKNASNVDLKTYFNTWSNQEKAKYWHDQDFAHYENAFKTWKSGDEPKMLFKSKFDDWKDFVALTKSGALGLFKDIFKNSKYIQDKYASWKWDQRFSQAFWSKYRQTYEYLELWHSFWTASWTVDYFRNNYPLDQKQYYDQWKASFSDKNLETKFLNKKEGIIPQAFYTWRDDGSKGFRFYKNSQDGTNAYNSWSDPLIHTETKYQTSDQFDLDFKDYDVPKDTILSQYKDSDQSNLDYVAWNDPKAITTSNYDDLANVKQTQDDFKIWYENPNDKLKKIMYDSGAYQSYYNAWDDPSIIADDDDVDTTSDKWNKKKIVDAYEKSSDYDTNLKNFRKGLSDIDWYMDYSPQSDVDYKAWRDPNQYSEATYLTSSEFTSDLAKWFQNNALQIYVASPKATSDYNSWSDPKMLTEQDYLDNQYQSDLAAWIKTNDGKLHYKISGQAKKDYDKYTHPDARTLSDYEKTTEFSDALKAWYSNVENGKATYQASAQSNIDYNNWDDLEKNTKAKFDSNYKNALHDAVNAYYQVKNHGINIYKTTTTATTNYNDWYDPNARTTRQYDANVGGEFKKDLENWLIKNNYANLINVFKAHVDSDTYYNNWWDAQDKRSEADYLLSETFASDLMKWAKIKANGIDTYEAHIDSTTEYNAWVDPLVRKKNEYEFSAQFINDLNTWSKLPNSLAHNAYMSSSKSNSDYQNWKDPLERTKAQFDNNKDGEYKKTYNLWLATTQGRSDALAIFKTHPYAIAQYNKWKDA